MKTYAIGMYEKAVPATLSWEERLTFAKEAGYDFVEISIDETEERLSRLKWSGKERASLIDTMQKISLPVRSMCLSGHRKYPIGSPDKETRRRGMEIMEEALVLASDLGIRMIQLAGYDVYYEESTQETQRLFLENLKEACRMAEHHGILMGFETMETPFMNTVEKAMHYVREVDSAYLGVYPDLGNITNAAKTYGTSVDDDLQSGAGHLIAMHLKETVPGVFREVPFGTGHVDFDAGIRKALDLRVRRFVTELWYTGEENWQAIVQEACRMMREKIDRALGIAEEET